MHGTSADSALRDEMWLQVQAAKESLQEGQRDQRRLEDIEARLRQAQADAARASQALSQAQQRQQHAEQDAKSSSGLLYLLPNSMWQQLTPSCHHHFTL